MKVFAKCFRYVQLAAKVEAPDGNIAAIHCAWSCSFWKAISACHPGESNAARNIKRGHELNATDKVSWNPQASKLRRSVLQKPSSGLPAHVTDLSSMLCTHYLVLLSIYGESPHSKGLCTRGQICVVMSPPSCSMKIE